MSRQVRRTERRRAAELADEFLEEDLLPDRVEADVTRHLDRGEPMRALRIIIRYRRDRP